MTGRVIVVGSVNIDSIVELAELPRPGWTVVAHRMRESPGGKGANQAVVAAHLGVESVLVACVGDDGEGAECRAILRSHGVDIASVTTADARTGRAFVFIDRSGENQIVVVPGANDALGGSDVNRALVDLSLTRSDVVLVSNEISEEAVVSALTNAQRHGCTAVYNPAPARPLPSGTVLRDVILTPNEHELELIGDRTRLSGQSAATLVRDYALRAVIVTLGSDGVRLTTDERELHVPAYAVPVVVDSTGAGDAFNAALAWSLTRGMSLEDGVRWAAAAGAFSTQAVGAQGSLPTIRLLELLAGLHLKSSEPPCAPPS